MMILLPGILSQGGGYYLWYTYSDSTKALQIGKKRSNDYSAFPTLGVHTDGYYYVLQNALFDVYGINYTETAGSQGTVSVSTYNSSYTHAADAYTRSKDIFTLTDPISTFFYEMEVGKYLVNASTINSTAESGEILYEVTNVTTTQKEETTSMSSVTYWGNWMRGWKSYSIQNGQFKLNGNWVELGPDYDTPSSYGYRPDYTSVLNDQNVSSGYYDTIYKYNLSSAQASASNSIPVSKITLVDRVSAFTYTPYTAAASKGTIADTIEAPADSLPSGGVSGDYWYVLKTA